MTLQKLTEEQRINMVLAQFKARYPRAKALGKDMNLIGEFLEVLVRQALGNMGFLVYAWPTKQGDRGIDARLLDDSYHIPLHFAIECMNGTRDYSTKYLGYLLNRIKWACSQEEFPIIVCVDKAVNLKNLKSPFACPTEYVELRKQYHPNSTAYGDYLFLKEELRKATSRIALKEREEEETEREMWREEEKQRKEAWEAMEKMDEEEFDERVKKLLEEGEEVGDQEDGWNIFGEGPSEDSEKSDG